MPRRHQVDGRRPVVEEVCVARAMRIGLIADTHLASRRLPPGRWWDRFVAGGTALGVLLDALAEVWTELDEIWHAGDVAAPEVLAVLGERFAVPVRAVRGNADRGAWAQELPDRHTAEIAGRRLVMVHGWGSPRFIVDRLMARLGWAWDVVVFGHTHQPLVRRWEGVLFVNPGSPTDRRFAPYRSVALLEVTAAGATAQLFDLEPRLTSRPRPLE